MLAQLDLTTVLFLDIETVSEQPDFDSLSPTFQELWRQKCKSILKKYDDLPTDEDVRTCYVEKAGIYAEFGKIVCISVGIVVRDAQHGSLRLRLKSYTAHHEAQLLQDFADLLTHYYHNPAKHFLCGHNLREFDIPYICRRMMIHQLPLPRMLDISGAKPWETNYLLDTMVMWRFGDIKSYTSLKLLCGVFGIPSPKDDIDGSEVGRTYWETGNVGRIATYCEKDVLAVVQLLLRYKLLPLLDESQITYVAG